MLSFYVKFLTDRRKDLQTDTVKYYPDVLMQGHNKNKTMEHTEMVEEGGRGGGVWQKKSHYRMEEMPFIFSFTLNSCCW